jgi:hypothetical protein
MGGKQDNGDYALARSQGATITPGVRRVNGLWRLSEERSEYAYYPGTSSKGMTMDAVAG